MATRAVASKARMPRPDPLAVTLSELPRTALPDDLRRLCSKIGVENVDHVAINYKRFRPTGTATLTFTRPDFVTAATKSLDKAILGGRTLKATRAEARNERPPRTRGVKGTLEAGQRGIIDGNGPDAGVTGGGKNVLLRGLPGRLFPAMLAENLRDFKLAGREQGRPVVVKLEMGATPTWTSQFLVRMASVSEAYRLVRSFHMQKFRPDHHGDLFVVHASIVS